MITLHILNKELMKMYLFGFHFRKKNELLNMETSTFMFLSVPNEEYRSPLDEHSQSMAGSKFLWVEA